MFFEKIKGWKKKWLRRENTRARVQRNSVLVENTKWVRPTGKVVNPCRDIRTWIAEKTFTEYFCISTSRVSLCWVKRKSPPNRLFKSEFKKRSFFVQTINDTTCSNRIIHYLNKETRRVKRENYSIDRMISLHLQWLWNSNSHWRWRENLLSLHRRLNVLKTPQLNCLLW